MYIKVCHLHYLLLLHYQAATKKQKYEKISEKKMSTPVEVLCKVCKLTQCLMTTYTLIFILN